MRARIAAAFVMLLGVALLSGASLARAQSRDISSQIRAEHRVALVIGNAAYSESPLRNPVNDVRGMAETLRAQGFDVIEVVNADNIGMRLAVAEFGERMREGGAGLFYYSGHGMQVNGRNYLIPIGAQIRSEAFVSAETLDVDSVLGQMDGARSRVNVVILDACRNNPFARRFRSTQRGLAFMQAPLGTFIAYATSPGDVADDGPAGGYGIFTGELLKAMREPLRIEDVFKRVGLAVQQRTQRRQTPWTASNLTGDFSFTSAIAATAVPSATPQATAPIGLPEAPTAAVPRRSGILPVGTTWSGMAGGDGYTSVRLFSIEIVEGRFLRFNFGLDSGITHGVYLDNPQESAFLVDQLGRQHFLVQATGLSGDRPVTLPQGSSKRFTLTFPLAPEVESFRYQAILAVKGDYNNPNVSRFRIQAEKSVRLADFK